ncbi:MAG: glycoside hydrolase family 75 protein [Candidatus Competibacteraceae bacterium]
MQLNRLLPFLLSILLSMGVGAAAKGTAAKPSVQAGACKTETVLQFNRQTSVWRLPGKSALFFMDGMAVSAHGAPNAYDPDDQRGLDVLARAGRKGNWWSIATDNGKLNGKPLIQKDGPFKGFYISQTSLRDNTKKNDDITKYVDSTLIPYFALPPQLVGTGKAMPGDLGMVFNAKTGKSSFAIFADVGARDSIGEGSIALAGLLDVPNDRRNGKALGGNDIIYVVFPGTASKPAWPRSIEDIRKTAEASFQKWGGPSQLKACFPNAK